MAPLKGQSNLYTTSRPQTPKQQTQGIPTQKATDTRQIPAQQEAQIPRDPIDLV